jgi:hypothetical protein
MGATGQPLVLIDMLRRCVVEAWCRVIVPEQAIWQNLKRARRFDFQQRDNRVSWRLPGPTLPGRAEDGIASLVAGPPDGCCVRVARTPGSRCLALGVRFLRRVARVRSEGARDRGSVQLSLKLPISPASSLWPLRPRPRVRGRRTDADTRTRTEVSIMTSARWLEVSVDESPICGECRSRRNPWRSRCVLPLGHGGAHQWAAVTQSTRARILTTVTGSGRWTKRAQT